MALYNAVVTNDGRQLFAEAAAGGGQVIPVRVDTGDGTLGATDPTTLSNLIHLVQSYDINSSNALVPYQASFHFIIDSSDVDVTYQLREVGLIGKIGSGPETLIYYSSTVDPPDTIAPGSGDSEVLDFNTLTIVFSNTPNTIATLTAAVPPALHAITHLHRLDGSSPDPIPTANSADYGLCPATPNDSTKVLLGGTTASFGNVPVHAPQHIGTGVDPLPLSTTAASGALRALSGDPATFLNGQGNWAGGFFPGFITDYGGSNAPQGWLICDGSAVSRSIYAALFAAIGVLHGAGDGSTTFNVPDCRGRVSVGAGNGPGLTARGMGAKGGEENHVLTVPELPIHSHTVNDPGHAHSVADPSHAHSVADPSHAHSILDPMHSHGVIGPTNYDDHVPSDYTVQYADPAKGQGMIRASPNVVTADTTMNLTRLSIFAALTGIGIYGSYTGIGIYPAGTGISLANTGGNAGHNTMQPFVVLNKIIKF